MGFEPPARAAGCVVGTVQVQDWKTRTLGGTQHRCECQLHFPTAPRICQSVAGALTSLKEAWPPYLPWSGGLQGQVGFTLAPVPISRVEKGRECSVDSVRPCAVNVTFRLITVEAGGTSEQGLLLL